MAKYKNGHTCVRSTFRGKPCCSGSIPKYNALAKAVGMAIYLKLINGAWSSLSASGNTHAGGGAGDFEGDGYTAEQVNFIARCAREVGLIAYPRLWKGNWHIHVLDPDCQTLSAAAKAQIVLFNRGLNALVDNGPDPLGGYKKAELMARYNSRMTILTLPPAPAPALSGGVYTVRSGDTLGKIAASYKTTVDALVKLNGLKNPNSITVGQKLRVSAAAPAKPAPAKPVVRKPDTAKPTGPYPWPNKACFYGPSSSTDNRWYSGKVGSPIRSKASIQWHIKRIQKMVGAGVDGFYGDKGKSQTADKVKAWQKAHGLTADGIVGPGTWAKMVSLNKG